MKQRETRRERENHIVFTRALHAQPPLTFLPKHSLMDNLSPGQHKLDKVFTLIVIETSQICFRLLRVDFDNILDEWGGGSIE